MLEVLSRQPNFPTEDLHSESVAQVTYYAFHERSYEPYAKHLEASLTPLYKIGHQSLQILGIDTVYSEANYKSFCEGFALLEYMSLLVNQRGYNSGFAVRNTKELLVDSRDLVDFEIASRYATWKSTHPNTQEIAMRVGLTKNESLRELHARTLGAHIAAELQSAA